MASEVNSSILVEVAPGELIDKITILEIKNERISDPGKLVHVRTELEVLSGARDKSIEGSETLRDLSTQLRSVNEALWDIEDRIRICEKNQDFGPQFVELARSVYKTNDRRAALKREVNELLGSRIVEEKDYEEYQ